MEGEEMREATPGSWVLGLSFREFGIGNFSWRAVAGARGGVKSDQNQG
jgi:hypothetical protein